jgi:hypothetical protein
MYEVLCQEVKGYSGELTRPARRCSGVRLDLADLTDSPLPTWTLIVDINDNGDLIGIGSESRGDLAQSFLLRRVRPVDQQGGDPADSLAASSPEPSVAGIGRRRLPTLEAIQFERLQRERVDRRFAKSGHLRRG